MTYRPNKSDMVASNKIAKQFYWSLQMPLDQKKIDVIRSDQSLAILDELGVGAFTVNL